MHGLYETSANDLQELISANGLDALSIKVFPRDLRGNHKLSITGLKRLSVNVCPRDVRESVDVTS